MKPALFAIFAHPDDEAFGPGGTLALYAKTHDVYIICATRGEAGDNNIDGDTSHLGNVREHELKESAKILGAKNVFFLDFRDGCLCNSVYHEVAREIMKITDKYKPEILLTYEMRGVSGHLDHVAVSLITHYVFQKTVYTKKLMAFCIPFDMTDGWEYFVYVPPGLKRDEMDETIDVSSVWDTKMKALNKHKSQIKEVSSYLEEMLSLPKDEHFMIVEK